MVGFAGGFEFVEQHAESVDAVIDEFLIGVFGTGRSSASRNSACTTW